MAAHPWLIVIVVNKILPLWMGFFYAFSVTFLRKNPAIKLLERIKKGPSKARTPTP